MTEMKVKQTRKPRRTTRRTSFLDRLVTKSMSTTVTERVIYKHTDAAIRSVDRAGRRFTAVASMEVVDRDGDVILADGIDTANFSRNPVALADHDRTKLLGNVTAWRIQPRPEGRAFVVDVELSPGPGASGWRDEVWGDIQSGARRGISIGFMPKEASRERVLSGQTGDTFTRVELLEVSSVSLPSCPTCLIDQKAFGAGRDVLEIEPPACTCASEPIVLELLDDPVADHARGHSHAGESTVDVEPAVLAGLIAAAFVEGYREVRSQIPGMAAREAQRAVDRARGRVD